MSREFWATVSVGITVIAVTVTGFAILSGRINALENRLDARITSFESKLDARTTSFETNLGARITSLSRIEGRQGLPDEQEQEAGP